MSFLANNETIIDTTRVASFANVVIQSANAFVKVDAYPNAVGEVSGYVSGGGPALSDTNVIQKFPFASDSNSTDVGDLTNTRTGATGQSSDVSGYTSGGLTFPPAFRNTTDKFPFATDTDATDVGNLTVARVDSAGQSSSAHGYTSGGTYDAPPSPNPSPINTIDKFPFSVDINSTDVGDLSELRELGTAGQSSRTHGYSTGGRLNPPISVRLTTIDKFPFATDTNASDVGDLTQARERQAGQSSEVSGYTSGGFAPPDSNVIDKFPFATDTNATDVGDLTQARDLVCGQSSTLSGYTSGGNNRIDKFPFATDGNATDVGDLLSTVQRPAGQQD